MYICPKCRSSKLCHSFDSYECTNCHSKYDIVAGIPDFRIFRDRIYSNPIKEAEQVKILLENYSSKSFEQLLQICMGIEKCKKESNYLGLNLIKKNINSIVDSLNNGNGVMHFLDRFGMRKDEILKKAILDVGCGFCNNTLPLSKFCKNLIALDISLPHLIVARKMLQEQGVSNLVLACGCSEALPFSDKQFDYVFASGVIEHVQDQNRFAAETYRVLKDDGNFFFSSPNRFFIGREPHVGIPLVGFLPRKLMKLYVNVLTGRKLTYEGKRLLSYRELVKLLRKYYKKNWECQTYLNVDISSPAKSTIGKIYRQYAFFRRTVTLLDKIFCKAHIICGFKRRPTG